MLTLRRCDRAYLAGRRQHVHALGQRRPALLIEQAHQGFAHAELGDGRGYIQTGVGAHGVGCGLDRLLVARGEGAQRVLHPVAQLSQHRIGDVQWVLCHKKHAHALGAYQPHHQLDALNQRLGRVIKEQMRLVKKEHQFGLVQVAYLGQGLEQLAQQPQQKSGVQARRIHQLVRGQDVDHPLAAAIGLHEIGNIEHGLAKKAVAALRLDLHQAALNSADAGGADVAVLSGVAGGVVAHVLAHGAQVFHVQQQQSVVVGNLKHQLQHAGLGVVQVEHARQQQWPQIAHCGAHRVALLPKHIPQRGRECDKVRRIKPTLSKDFG